MSFVSSAQAMILLVLGIAAAAGLAGLWFI